MRTIAIVNQKGGCGKTTTAINLAAVLAHRGLRTLLVDMDPQSHCATGLGVPEGRIEQSICEALLKADSDRFDPTSVIWEVGGNFDLLPSTVRLAGLEAPGGGLHELPDRDRRLARLLARFSDHYDRCLIDCPPSIGLLTFNALRAAREALIPVETGFFALRGADSQWRTIRQLIERIGRPIACHLVPTLYDPESALATDILAALGRQFAGQVIPVVIREHEVVREAASFGQPVVEYAAASAARDDFEKLADWLEDHPPRSNVQIEVMPGATGALGGDDTACVGPGPGGETPLLGRAAELARRVRSLQTGRDKKLGAVRINDRSAWPRTGESIAPPPPPPPPPAPAESRVRVELPAPVESPAPVERPTKPGTRTIEFGFAVTGGGVQFAQPGEGHQSICVAGDFNRWSATGTPLLYEDGMYQAVVAIPPGRYCYRLVVDGAWKPPGQEVCV